jgi:hypothetical protein
MGFELTLGHLVGLVRQEAAPAAREAVIGHGGHNAGEQASRPANAHAQEDPRGVGGDYYGA